MGCSVLSGISFLLCKIRNTLIIFVVAENNTFVSQTNKKGKMRPEQAKVHSHLPLESDGMKIFLCKRKHGQIFPFCVLPVVLLFAFLLLFVLVLFEFFIY